MPGIYTPLIGRFGNKMFQWAHAKALSEDLGLELVTPPWEGERIFEIERTRQKRPDDIELGGYRQRQVDLNYTRTQARGWFKVRQWVKDELSFEIEHLSHILCHRRVGDYIGYGYPVVSFDSYVNAIDKMTHHIGGAIWTEISDENPNHHKSFVGDLEFVPDFIRLMHAKVLFRGNSTFSWWAATLSDAEVYSPVIDGLEGGKEHDVEFVKGNHKKFCNLAFVTDLYLPE